MNRIVPLAIGLMVLSACSGASKTEPQTDRDRAAANPAPAPGPDVAPAMGKDTETPAPAVAERGDATKAGTSTPTMPTVALPASAAPKKPETKAPDTSEMTAPAAFAICAACHSVKKGEADKPGPNLWGVYGRKAGQGGFAYSQALSDSDIVWNAQTLDAWLKNPRDLIDGNRMAFPGVKDETKRHEIIEYLERQR